MQVKVRTFAACALLVLLLVPVAAGAGRAEVKGPLTLGGQGFFGGELELEPGEGQRSVRIAGRAGYVGFLDLGGDLKVRCLGRGRVVKHATERGMVYLCKGQVGQAVALGSHFAFRGFAKRFVIQLPEGASGTLNGQFRRDGEETRERPDGREAERGERRKEQKEQNASIPTVAQLAAMLAAATAG